MLLDQQNLIGAPMAGPVRTYKHFNVALVWNYGLRSDPLLRQASPVY